VDSGESSTIMIQKFNDKNVSLKDLIHGKVNKLNLKKKIGYKKISNSSKNCLKAIENFKS
jgi:hypothetical protein